MIGYDGTVHQSAHDFNENDYGDERMYFPVLGIVLDVKSPDDPTNKSNVKTIDQIGSRIEATVLVTNSGLDSNWIIPNAVVLPHGACGVDNFHEETPRPSTQMINGAKFNGNLSNIDYNLLDGDRVIVSFIGGMINQPVITHWFPHPGNTFDPATAGIAEGALAQMPRYFKRFNGVKTTITNKGNVFVDTNDAGSINTSVNSQFVRKSTKSGGEINIDVKEDAHLLVDFNPTVSRPESEPSLRQANGPSAPKVEESRTLDNTTLLLTKEFIVAAAGVSAEITADESISLSAGDIRLGSAVEEQTDEINQVVIGSCVDPFTGKTLYMLGGTSSEVKATK